MAIFIYRFCCYHFKKLKYTTQLNLRTQPHIRIVGQCHKGAKKFEVNLNTGSETTFHFNPRFNEKAIVRNSTKAGVWQKEERVEKDFPFHHDKVFTLDFVFHPDHLEVQYDGKHIIRFIFRDDPTTVNTLVIDGDLELHSVALYNATTNNLVNDYYHGEPQRSNTFNPQNQPSSYQTYPEFGNQPLPHHPQQPHPQQPHQHGGHHHHCHN
uniref:Galectin n=1 Tax=Rhabditophanes sp. KR3021 TaxID=114890 RepID=A0AC35TZG7_9BILA